MMFNKRFKTYLSIPVFLGMLLATGQVSADETEQPLSDQSATTELATTVLEDANEPAEAAQQVADAPAIATRASTSPSATGEVSYQLTDQALSVAYEGELSDDTQVLYAFWSDRRGQDDLYWYPANTTGEAVISFANHKDYGTYHLHTYTNTAGQLVRVGQDTLEREAPGTPPTSDRSVLEPGRARIDLSDYRETKTNFTIKIASEPAAPQLTKVEVAVWSKDKGQDDIRWYEPVIINQKASVNVRIADLSNTSGLYQAHVYTTYADGKTLGTSLGEFQITKPAPTEPARVELFDYHETKNDFSVRVLGDENTKEIADVRIAVWSHDKGQDDIRWYEPAIANNQASVTINSSNHSKKTDTYTVHVYTTYKDGSSSTTNLGDLRIVKKEELTEAKIEVTDLQPHRTSFTVKVTGSETTKVIEKVQLAVWSDKNGQDDIKWYYPTVHYNKASQLIDIANHANTTDDYHVYVYTTYTDQTTVGTALGPYHITKPAPTGLAKVEVTDYRPNKTDFTVRVTSTADTKPIASVRVAVWSQGNGQDDLKWYAPNVVNNQASQKVSITNHSNTSDRYVVHVYTTYQDGQVVGSNLGDYAITVPTPAPQANPQPAPRPRPVTSASQGRYDVLNRIIYLDAGHGGTDPGAVYGATEKALNLSIQSQLKSRLEAAGYQVVTTRTTDQFVDLLDRSRLANASLSDLFVSIHFNASTDRSVQGIETYHYQAFPEYPAQINAYHDHAARHERSAYLAQAIQSATVNSTQAINRGVHRRTFAVLRETVAPAVLLELGYMSNPTENAKITQPAYQAKLVDGIFNGILSYYRRFSS